MIKLISILKEILFKEDPDTVRFHGEDLEYYDGGFAFIFDQNGNLLIGDENSTHGELDPELEDYDSREDWVDAGYEYAGRMWPRNKVVSFWDYPSTVNELDNVLTQIEGQSGIEILGMGWTLNTSEEKNVDLDTYIKEKSSHIKNRSAAEMGKEHEKSPMLKVKQNVPQGMGSQKRPADLSRSQYNSLKGRTSDGTMKLGNILREDPNYVGFKNSIEHIKKGTDISFENGGRPFVFYKDQIYTGELNGTHEEMAFKNHLPTVDIWAGREGIDLKWAGRYWKNLKLISFWDYPKTKGDLIVVIRSLEKKIRTPILGQKWVLNIAVEDDYVGDNVSLDIYLGSDPDADTTNITNRTASQKAVRHVQSPMDKQKTDVPQGMGSQKRPADLSRSQYNAFKGRTSDGAIKLGNILREDPDKVVVDFPNDFRVASFQSRNGHAFAYYKDKLFIGDDREVHGKMFPNKNARGKGNSDFQYLGRFWTEEKIISFWDYPPTIPELVRVIKDLENKQNIKMIGDDWVLNIVDEEYTEKNVKLDDYIQGDKSVHDRSDVQKAVQHVLSPLAKTRNVVPPGMGSMKRPSGLPLSQYYAKSGRTSDGTIKLGNLLEADVSKINVEPISREQSIEFVKKHYLKGFPGAPTDYIGIFYSGELVGVVIYGSPTSPAILASIVRPMTGEEAAHLGRKEGDFPFTIRQIKELQRMYIKPLPEDVRKNMATMSIARANKLIEEKYEGLKIIVSYSDPVHHVGTIYKASNAIYMGRGRTDKYVWIAGDRRNKQYIKKFLKV